MFDLRFLSFTKSNIRTAAWLGAVFLAALAGCRPGPVTPLLPATDSPPRRAAAHGFPRLANQYQLCCRDDATEALFERLHLWDLAIIDAEIINAGGVIASYSSTNVPEPVLPYYPFALKGVTLRMVQAFILPLDVRKRFFKDICDRLERGELQHRVGARFPLEDIVAAHEAMEEGKVIGKIIVDIP